MVSVFDTFQISGAGVLRRVAGKGIGNRTDTVYREGVNLECGRKSGDYSRSEAVDEALYSKLTD